MRRNRIRRQKEERKWKCYKKMTEIKVRGHEREEGREEN